MGYLEENKRFKFLKKLIPKTTYEHATHLPKLEKMRLVCEELGPSFVKFGFIIAGILALGMLKDLHKGDHDE